MSDDPEDDDTEGYSEEDDEFDYDEFVDREFGGRELGPSRASTTLRPIYRLVAVVLIIAFALSLLYPLWF